MAEIQESDLLKVREVARYLRCSQMSVYRLIRSGELAAYKITKDYRIPRSALEEFLKRSAV